MLLLFFGFLLDGGSMAGVLELAKSSLMNKGFLFQIILLMVIFFYSYFLEEIEEMTRKIKKQLIKEKKREEKDL